VTHQPTQHRRIPRWIWLTILVALVGALGLALVLRGTGDDGPAPQDQADQAAAEQDQPDYDRQQARNEVRQLQQQLLNVVNREHEPKKLLPQAEELVQKYPEFVPARKLFGQLLLHAEQEQAGYEQMTKALERDDSRPKLQNLAGTLALRLGKYDRALGHYSEAVGLAPNQPKYRAGLAKALIETQELERAREELLKALNQDSSYHLPHAMLAQLYRRQNKLGLAREHIRKALDRLPEEKEDQRSVYVRRRAELLRRDNRWDEAISVLQDLPPKQRLEKHVLEELARNWALRGEPERAASLYARALNLKPNDEQIAAAAVEWAIEAGWLDQARAHLKELRRINSASPKINSLRERIAEAEQNQTETEETREG